MSIGAEDGQGSKTGPAMRVLRFLTLFVFFPIILPINACSLLVSEQRDAASSGMLTAKVILVNPGAMSSYSGSVWVLPRYFPPIWPLDKIVGCRALNFSSDPRIDVRWEDTTLIIQHDSFLYPATGQGRCYGRPIMLRQRLP